MDYSRRDFVKTLFIASQGAVAGKLFAGDLTGDSKNSSRLHFAVIGDWGRKGEADQKDVAAQMASAAAMIGAKFVISLGDNFYEDGVGSIQDEHWEKSFEQVYAATSLQVPWKVILGNHDYRGNCDAQLEYSRMHPRWGMPARYYRESHALEGTTADFFYIDTSPMLSEYYQGNEEVFIRNLREQDVAAQLTWLEKALAASQAPWKIVFGHHPIYSIGGHGSEPDLIAKILPLLQKHGVQAYFCGHDHDLQHLQSDKVNFFVSGGGSRHRTGFYENPALFARATSGFATVALGAQELRVQFIDSKGVRLYEASVAQKI